MTDYGKKTKCDSFGNFKFFADEYPPMNIACISQHAATRNSASCIVRIIADSGNEGVSNHDSPKG